MDINNIKALLIAMGFGIDQRNINLYVKDYKFGDYSEPYNIIVDIEKGIINYGDFINIKDTTTSNFSHDENFVVIECIDRLLEKGYNPKDITLEKKWKLGRLLKSGKADITITGKNDKTILIIECKKWGAEYELEKVEMKRNGGQLFSYYQQEKDTRFLCLYASHFNGIKINYKNSVISVQDSQEEKDAQSLSADPITFANANNISDMLKVWLFKIKKHKTDYYLEKGIFEKEVEAYNPGYAPLKISDLKDMTDSKGIYLQFEEILRHNNISDRSNAFNRFISLVLAKIVDESKADEERADFQILEGIDDGESLQERLQALYTRAMHEYLKEKVINYTLEDIENLLKNFPRQTTKEHLKKIYKELKFYTNNEFAFKEVYNKDLFEQNAEVLFEVVRLFQSYKFKHIKKSQFLGDFFEDMLESGYKQSEGQFFTPTPISKFIVSSLPIKEIIKKKIEDSDTKPLPYIIDYACGSGHFITESLEEIHQVVSDLVKEDEEIYAEKLGSFLSNMDWAGEYICGIEKDYRLARTSQVACFMHGDGNASIIYGDGLEVHDGANFTKAMPAENYDFLIANPPYSVKNFSKYLNLEKLPSFELLPGLGNDSNKIETLFIERSKQLLKVGGYAGIILPSSVLSSNDYSSARELLLKYFEFKAIVEFGGLTFQATNTQTVVLFLKRRSDDYYKDCQFIADDLINQVDQNRKSDFINSQEAFIWYLELLEVSIKDYRTLLNRHANAEIKTTNFWNLYQKWYNKHPLLKQLKNKSPYKKASSSEQSFKELDLFYELVIENEYQKFLYFLLTHKKETKKVEVRAIKKRKLTKNEIVFKYLFKPQVITIVRSGKKTILQKEFLGYKFSERRGYKGLEFIKKETNGNPITKLYDDKTLYNKSKINYYINSALLDNPFHVFPQDLSRNISVDKLSDCVKFNRIDMDKSISLAPELKVDYQSVWNTTKLIELTEDIVYMHKGTSITKEQTMMGDIPVIAGGQTPAYTHNISNREGNVITISASGAYAGFVNYFTNPIFASDCTTLKSKDEKVLPTGLLYILLKSIQSVIYRFQRGASQPHVYADDIGSIKIPDLRNRSSIQNKIIEEIRIIDDKENMARLKIKQVREEISEEVGNLNGILTPLSVFADVNPEKNLEGINDDSQVSFIEMASVTNDGLINWDLVEDRMYSDIKSGFTCFQDNDTLFAKITPCMENGKGAFVEGLTNGIGFGSTEFIVVRPKQNLVVPKLIHYFLQQKSFRERAEKVMTGKSGHRRVPKGFLEEFKFPLPNDILIQNKIVEKLEKMDSLIESLNSSILNIELEKKSVLDKYIKII